MRRIPAAAMAALLLFCALALAGCSTWFESSAQPANDAIATANAHMEKAVTAGASVSAAATRLESIPYTPAGAADALELTSQIKSDLATQKAELAAAKASMDSIAKLEVAGKLKTYAGLEAAALGTRVRVVDLGTKLYTEMERLYSTYSEGKGEATDTQEILTSIDSIKRDITAVSELAAQQSKAASDYFTAQKLGG